MASIQLSKSQPSPARAGPFVLSWFMAWSPLRRANAGISWVRKPGDYANLFPPLPGRHPPMLPDLKRDADGGVTIYIQSESPGADKEANWLPAPKAPFMMAMRYYWPKSELLEEKWKSPEVMPAK
jgi:hypothetical protein